MDKKIKALNLGSITGKVLLFGGVYSNLQALEALIAYAVKEGIPPENCICTGDIVGYCAQPEETIQTFKNWNAKSILGNVEIQLRDDQDHCGCDFKAGSQCDNLSQQWYPYAKSKLSKDSLSYLNSIPDYITFTLGQQKVTVLHGSYFNISEFIFKSTPWEKKRPNFEITQSDIIIAGHSGLPFYNKVDNNYWINPGVIGMPANDGNSKVWFTVIDDSIKPIDIQFRKLDYNHKLTHTLMINAPLPEAYAKTILSGIWDNMDILPETEKKQQGQPIQL
ncbi:metallophosphoesterase family protein [Psychroserpens damuponensis]|uniref:metallophosphoesterase family protein n=1 Tax=Psychroserpens damuponensis TaxID=943936 RepID=UPI00058D172E|nr:metallophosphoesterase family protein [Psychroserpens damuponensis]